MPIFAPFLAALGTTVTANAIAGASLLGTTILSIAGASGRNRTIGIEISNLFEKSVELTYVGNYLDSGVEYTPPQPTIQAGRREGCGFAKTSDTACGSVGVMVYKITASSSNKEQVQECYMVMMWSVPFDYNLYDNWFAIGMKDYIAQDNINKSLWREMYYDDETWFQRKAAKKGRPCDITFGGIRIIATMSDVGNAVMKVEAKPTDEVMIQISQIESNKSRRTNYTHLQKNGTV